jgi:hypothetical protein
LKMSKESSTYFPVGEAAQISTFVRDSKLRTTPIM